MIFAAEAVVVKDFLEEIDKSEYEDEVERLDVQGVLLVERWVLAGGLARKNRHGGHFGHGFHWPLGRVILEGALLAGSFSLFYLGMAQKLYVKDYAYKLTQVLCVRLKYDDH